MISQTPFFFFSFLTYQIRNPEDPIAEKVLFHPVTSKPCSQQGLNVELKAKPISFPGLEEDNGKGTERKRRKEHVGQMCASPLPLSEPWGRGRTPVVREVKGGGCGSWRLSEAHKDTIFRLFLHYTYLYSSSCAVLFGSQSPTVCFPGLPKAIDGVGDLGVGLESAEAWGSLNSQDWPGTSESGASRCQVRPDKPESELAITRLGKQDQLQTLAMNGKTNSSQMDKTRGLRDSPFHSSLLAFPPIHLTAFLQSWAEEGRGDLRDWAFLPLRGRPLP